jgi:hypothetical protein
MYKSRILSFSLLLCGVFGLDGAVRAQNINTQTPFTSVNDSYYENFGVNFGFSIPGGRGNGSRVVGYGPQGQLLPNLVFQNGSGGAIPRFGGYSPNSGATFGFGNRGANGGGFSLGFNLAQGSTRTSTTVVPSLTTQNGFGGSLISGQTRPFVTGVLPVVGGGFSNVRPGLGNGFNSNGASYYQPDNGVTRALQSGQLDLTRPATPAPRPESSKPISYSDENSSALHGDLSVAQIKAERKRRLVVAKRQFDDALAEAKQLEENNELEAARAKYRQASGLTKDKQLKKQIAKRIKATRTK